MTASDRTGPDTLDAIRRDMGRLINDPQTALSDGFGPAIQDFADAVDLASLDRARSRHLRRRAMDAVDHLIALLDALDAEQEDIEPDADDDLEHDGREDDDPAEEDDPPEDGGDSEPTLGAPERSPWVASLSDPHYEHPDGRRPWRGFAGLAHNQIRWDQGACLDGEGEAEPGYDLACDEDELDDDGSGLEPSIGWPNDFRAVLSDYGYADDDREADDADLEADGERMAVRRLLGLLDTPAASLLARAKALRSGIPAPDHGLPRPWIGPDRVFGLHVVGECCAPEILNHGAVHVDREVTPVAGDFVALWFEAERAGRRVMVGWVKRLTCDLPPVRSWPYRAAPEAEVVPLVIVESLNPPRTLSIDASKVHAVFKVVAVIPPAEAIARRAQRARATQH